MQFCDGNIVAACGAQGCRLRLLFGFAGIGHRGGRYGYKS